MKQLNNNTFGKNSWSRHWEKLCFLRNTLKKILGAATVQTQDDLQENMEKKKNVTITRTY